MSVRLFLAVFLFAATMARADELHVAVAANFTAPMHEIAAGFEKASGHRLLLSFGATGKFYAQIRQGAPFDVLLAADDETPTRLEKEGWAVPGTRITYAIGKLALWSPTAGYVDAHGKVLARATFAHLSIANPRLAPYGAAAIETLQALKLLQVVQPRFVQAESIGQAYQFVATGNAELGFVALAQICGNNSGSRWIVPAALYQPIRQDAVILGGARSRRSAEALLNYLQSEPVRALIKTHCYDL